MENNPVKLLFNLTETTGKILKDAASKGVILAPDNVVEERINMCYTCEFLQKESARCKACGCFMNIKARFNAAECPAGKWSQ